MGYSRVITVPIFGEMKQKILTDVQSIILSGEDPNRYHIEDYEFMSLTIVMKDGKHYQISGCSHCGALTLGVEESSGK